MRDIRKVRYCSIKHSCKYRLDAAGNPIEFRLTFADWWQIWEASGKWDLCGKRSGQYCMSRYNDVGHYEVGNVYIQLTSENSRQANKGVTRRFLNRSEDHKQKISAALKGRTLPAEQKQKQSATMKGRKLLPETIAKIQATKIANGTTGKGRKQAPEEIAKRLATQKANREKRKQENR